MPGMRGGAADQMHMDMGGSASAGADQKAPVQHHERVPCNLPWAPGSCTGLAPCAPPVILTVAAALLPIPGSDQDAVQLAMVAPQSRTIPPELPPPRA